jgi:hypothetical protein
MPPGGIGGPAIGGFLFRNLRDLLATHAAVVLVKAGPFVAFPAVQPSAKLGALLQRKLFDRFQLGHLICSPPKTQLRSARSSSLS